MKVLLINPPTKNMIKTNVPDVVEQERGHSPPLGIMYVASYAKKYTNHEIRVLDAEAKEMSYDKLEQHIQDFYPDIVGISVTTFTVIDSVETAKRVKKINPEIKVVFGGPHVFIYPEETANLPYVDYVVIGEGEITFKEFLDNFKNVESVKGLVYKKNGKLVNTGLRNLIEDLDSLPFPDRTMLDLNDYSSLISNRSPITTLFSSRGCPFQCGFCMREHLGKKFRARSAKNVVDEMEQCYNLGIEEFLIYDDTFTVSKERTIEICNEILKRNLKVYWDIRTRVDTVDKELLELMKKAGCERINYGVESGVPRILKNLNKGITIEKVKKTFKTTKKLGITTLAYFMIGNPGEMREDIITSIKFAKKLKPDYVHFAVFTPFPNTQLYFDGLEMGLFNDYWKEFAKNPQKDFNPKHWEEILTEDETIELLTLAYKKFYMRPTYFLKVLLRIRSFGELKRKLHAGLKVLKI